MRRARTLLIDEVIVLPKAIEFLNSKAIGSKSTKNTYGIALAHLQTFLKTSELYRRYDVETVLEPLKDKTIDVYVLFRNFVDYLINRQDQYFGGKKLTPASVGLYVAGVMSYFDGEDIDISSKRFKKKVTLPRKHRTFPEAIDKDDITNMLNHCTNERLKAFILLLATTGMRANEALLLKNSDIDFSTDPTTIHIRAEITKTKQTRDIYTTYEATKFLKIFIDSKYKNSKPNPDHLLFKLRDNDGEHKGRLYPRLSAHFKRLLEKIEMDKHKNGDNRERREITFHSFRRFLKTTISNQGLRDYSESLLGHYSSMSGIYYSMKEGRTIYKKLEKHLTFLDKTLIETKTREIESKLEQNEKEFESKLKQRDEEVEILREKNTKHEEQIKKLQKERSSFEEQVEKKIAIISKIFDRNELVDQMKFFNELPIKVDADKLTFSELATVLIKGRKFNLKGGVTASVEDYFTKKGILKNNVLDLKKLAEFDPEGKMLAALKQIGMVKRYQIK